ncbi:MULTISPECIES: thiolase family protein [Pseudonocardia]|uniref:Lipid-transfer protein n=2 Tax=Pseudonocardia TaxID=1847 RepID=A0A1Y2MP97_PSEAH|nr:MULTISPECIES: thiolase family protein [Pseudonocardia]OSY37055.1 lipid-transfer protein [Pseudonocardia autotrophica]TDN72028.1 acetyl-CoA acetyltransferase [Pseudonocardia autotrophica]BBG02723.1 acetyl-CoA acetyltransferase [Pseudonocardia autotrophica]GEC25944.1 acetyl-CoA acetyltransferase [Pseudonocardia saturnea]
MTGVAIVGAGMHRFGRTDGVSGRAQAVHAARAALADAGLKFSDMGFAFGGSHSAGDADTLVSELGLTGLPFINVYNGCATGGSALISAHAAIASGAQDVGIVIGFDKHPRGAFDTDPSEHGIGSWYGETGMMVTTQFFGMKIQRYLHDHDIEPGVLAAVAEKAFRNGARNPMAWRRKELSAAEIAAAPMISHPLTQYMYCSPGEGAVALVLARADRARDHTDRPVFLSGAAFRSRRYGSFEVFSPWLALDRADSPTSEASRAVFEQAGIAPSDVDVAQIQDTESGAELMHMAETGLCADGEQAELITSGATAIEGRLPINTDGGCLANGEPIGASGLRQVFENVLQLRGEAGDRQVPGGPEVGFTHVYGAPGISACTVLTREETR